MRLDFSFPRRVRLVYFGRIGLGILRNYVTETDVAIYENPRERLNVWVALRMLLSRNLSEFSYYRAFLRWRKPKFVITMEDNNVTFYATKVISPECKTLAIQNGLRKSLSHSATTNIMKELQHVDLLGYDTDIIATLGGLGTDFYKAAMPNSKAKVVEVGNLMNNALGPHDLISSERPRLVFVSKFPNRGTEGINDTWSSTVFIYSGEASFTAEQYFRVDSVVARECAAIAKERSMEFCVLGKRPKWQVGEYDYYAGHLQGQPWTYLPSSNQASSYEQLYPNDIIVNVDSTIGYELLARGLRIAFVTARMHVAGHDEITEYRFGNPLIQEPTGPYWTSVATSSEIRRVIEYVSTVSSEQWHTDSVAARELLLQYDPGNAILCQELDSLGIKNSGPHPWTRGLIPDN
jgi:surface carbohydrate biosynthesis protein